MMGSAPMRAIVSATWGTVRSLVIAGGQIKDLAHAGPPGPQVLEIRARGGQQHAAQAEPEMLRVADELRTRQGERCLTRY